jgi:hypothetical protein
VRSRPLTETHPDLAAQAYGWDPSTVSFGMAKSLGWICPRGHIYAASPNKRSSGRGCPFCSGSKVLAGFNDLATTHPELAACAHGWDPTTVSRGSNNKVEWRCNENPDQPHTWIMRINVRVRGQGCSVCAGKQIVVGINDLATTHPEIAAEADGWDPTTVTAGSNKKRAWLCPKGHPSEKAVNQRTSGYGCAFCQGLRVEVGYNDLATTHPEIAKEAWGWDPTTVVPGSERRVQWKCAARGHEWPARISPRTQRDVGCPYCAGLKVIPGENDCATTHPSLALEACGWDPRTVFAGTGKKLLWKCAVCDHRWESTGTNRVFRQAGCPACASYGYDPASPGWLYLLRHSELGLLKVGITNEPDVRLASHRSRGWEPLDLLGPMDGLLARDRERSILAVFRTRGAVFTSPELAGRFSGYTESWVDESYTAVSLRELMDAAEGADVITKRQSKWGVTEGWVY